MLQLTHRTHIITLLVVASVSSALCMVDRFQYSSTNTTTNTTKITTTTTAATLSSSLLPSTSSSTLSSSSSSLLSSSTSSTNTLAPTIATTTTTRPHLPEKNQGRECNGNIHIRNDLTSFDQLKDCRVVNGALTIALVSKVSLEDWDNVTFPLLTEITEYLILTRVQNLTSLSKLFPNLSVIRGKGLISNYALIIYEMMQLRSIDLPRLSDILRGSVRIESNPNLCFASTVNWNAICKHIFTPHFIKDNDARCNNRCPATCTPWKTSELSPTSESSSPQDLRVQGDVSDLGSHNNKSLFCWNNQDCHETCHNDSIGSIPMAPNGSCCSPMCAGGCYEGNNPKMCISCRFVSEGEWCVETCRSDLYLFEDHCISESDCEQKTYSLEPEDACFKDPEESRYKPIKLNTDKHGVCQKFCPPGQEEDPISKHRCKPCDKGKCRKVCRPKDNKPYMVTNIDSLRELKGCNVINGSLELSLRGGRNVMHELETVFQDLEEIEGYLKITRSYPIITLGFFRKLKIIRGSTIDRDYSFVIVDNPNLQELFMYNQTVANDQKQLEILGGKIFVHLNPRLCPEKIDMLKKYADVMSWDERDVSPHTNGDKEACYSQSLDVRIIVASQFNAKIEVENFARKLDDPRILLYYLINYREVPEFGTVNMFDGRDGCNSQNDVWKTLEETPTKNISDLTQTIWIEVKPATRYALYVKTYSILTDSANALSDIVYFRSGPSTPGVPRQLVSYPENHHTVIFSLMPPMRPNGPITHYYVKITRIPELEESESLDVCYSEVDREKASKLLSNNEPTQSHMTQANQDNSSPSNSSSPSKPGNSCSEEKAVKTDPEVRSNQVTFQDTVIEFIYLKRPCFDIKRSKAPKSNRPTRSIEHDTGTSDGGGGNDLPRDSENSRRQIITSTPETSESESGNQKPFFLPTIRYDNSSQETLVNITVYESGRDIRVKVTNLTFFSLYSIEVKACHDEFKPGPWLDKAPNDYHSCSLGVETRVRTKEIADNDKVNRSTMVFYPVNDTSSNTVTWESPERPNGAVLAYRVRYRFKYSSEILWNEVCMNLATYNVSRGFVMTDFSPGTYLLQVGTISMFESGTKLWSEEIEFEIAQTSILSRWAWSVILITSVVLVLFGAASGAYCFQKNARDDLIYASVNPDYVQYDPDEWEVDIAKLIVGPQIGTGSFGMVYKGQMITEKGKRECAIKTVPPTSTAKQRMDFLREASIMKQFDTFHVVKLLGVVSVTTPVYVIMEFMENGDLKEFLRTQRDVHKEQKKTLVDGIYLMAAQIADGMAYLASRKFVHRDLAARNCMVGENRIVKIGDFGLTRDIYANDYYRRDTQGRLPVRWMAPESLSDNICTSASDSWSYGIVLWEIVTFSAYPYQGLSNDEVIKRVIGGYTMPRPEHCPDKLYNIMQRCWRKHDKNRPTFLDIVEYLLPETEGKLYPNCFYRKPKVEGDSVALSIPEETNTTGIESYPLLSWPNSNSNSHANSNSNSRPNCLTNGGGENHINHDNNNPANNHNEKDRS